MFHVCVRKLDLTGTIQTNLGTKSCLRLYSGVLVRSLSHSGSAPPLLLRVQLVLKQQSPFLGTEAFMPLPLANLAAALNADPEIYDQLS